MNYQLAPLNQLTFVIDGLSRGPDVVYAQEEANGKTYAAQPVATAAVIAADRANVGSLRKPEHLRSRCEPQSAA